MANSPLIEIDLLRQLLDYDHLTGLFSWKSRPPEMFDTDALCAAWNSCYAGKPALQGENLGYRRGIILGRRFRSHRVAWAIYYGEWPNDQIDHINGIKTDNRIVNLRVVDASKNARNRKIPKNNRSGTVGVRFKPDIRKWTASISVNGKRKYLGVYERKEDAIKARKLWEAKSDYSIGYKRVTLKNP